MGAGVAGCAVAMGLDPARFDVTIAEKSRLPRIKLCGGCIGPPGLRQLERLGVRAEVRAVASSTDRWIGYADRRVVEVPTPPGIAVCRSQLDPILLSRAADRGVRTVDDRAVKIFDPGRRDQAAVVKIGGHRETFDLVVAANGLGGLNLTRWLPWIRPPHGPLGVGVHVRGEVAPGAIHMIIDHRGYVGLVSLPGGRVDVAAAIHGVESSPVQTLESMIRDSPIDLDLEPHRRIGNVMTTPPLRRVRTAAAGRVIAVGDALRYVEPFTGEGMTWALQSAAIAVESLHQSRPGEVAARYAATAQAAGRHQRRCARLTSMIHYAPTRRLAVMTLARFPILARPIVRHLASDR